MSTFMQLIAFVFFITGAGLITRINQKEFVNGISRLFLWKPKRNIKERVLESKGKKNKNYFLRLIEETVATLKMNKKEKLFPVVCMAAFTMSVLGVLVGLLTKNYLLVPVLGTGFLITPFVYVKLLSFHMKKHLNQELETTLSIITTSYIRSENIVSAIEENISYINQPVKEVFQQFLFEANMINPDIKKLIKHMKGRIQNSIFQEWCDALLSCQEDGKLKSTLLPIVKKLSHVRVVSVRLDAMLYEPVTEMIMMVLLVILNIPLIYLLNRQWFGILVNTVAGKTVLAVDAIIIFVAVFGTIKVTRPISYKR